MIFVDRSAAMNEEFAERILSILDENPKLSLVVYAPKVMGEKAEELVRRAKLVFTDPEHKAETENRNVFYFENGGASFGERKIEWNVKKIDLMTHLTVYSIAAATAVGCVLKGENLESTLRIIKANIENSTLNGSLGFSRLKELAEKEKRSEANLRMIAKALVSFPKGILAADESGGSIHKKFESMGIVDDEQHRRDYRNIFFTTKDLEKYVNGVILFDETARQTADNGLNFTEFLISKGIIPGI